MQLPAENLAPMSIVSFTRYSVRRLKAKKYDALATDLMKGATAVLLAARAVEDAELAGVDTLGDRDSVDDDADGGVQHFRGKLAGESVDAVKKQPYTQIFPEGVAFYTASPIDDVPARLKLFVDRVNAHASGHPDAAAAVAAASAGASSFATHQAAVQAAELKVRDLRVKLDAEEASLRRSLERTYGALIEEVGRASAERFFQRQSRSKKKQTPPTPGETPEG